MKTVTNYDILIEKIDVFIRKYYLNKVLRGTLILGAVMFCGFVLVLFSEYLGNFNSILRGGLFFGYLLVNAGLFSWLVLPPLFSYLKLGRVISHDEAARIIGKHFSHVEDKLLNTLQLKRLADQNPQQRLLIEASIDQKIVTLRPVTFPSAVRIKENVKYLKWIVVPVVIIIGLAFAAPAILKDNTEKLIKHDQYFAPKSPFEFVVTNPHLSATQGGDFKLDVKLTGNRFPNDVYLETGKNIFKLDKENTGSFHYLFSNVQEDIRFHLAGNDFASQEYRLIVNPRPTLLHFDADLQYPAYIQRKNEQIRNAGDLTVPAGTVVHWLLRAQNTTGIQFEWNGHLSRLENNNNLFEHQECIMKPGAYLVRAVNNQTALGDSVAYHINVTEDQAPTISVDEKRDSISSKAIYFNGKIKDDYGFSSLIFHYTIVGSDGQKDRVFSKSVNASLQNTETGFFYFWNLKQLEARPGEDVKYYFEVADNNTVSGPQRARTPERSLKIPTEMELDKTLDKSAESVREKLASAMKLADEIAKDKKKMRTMLLNKTAISFDEKKEIQDLLSKRDELNKMIQDAKDQNRQNTLNRQENQAQDKDLIEKENQMEKLLDNIMDPATEEMMKKLKKLLDENSKNLDPGELAQMQTDDKSLNKELNRALELMKQLDVTTKIKENIDQLNKLAGKQQQLAEQSKQTNADSKTLQQQQDNIKKDFAQVEKSLEDVAKKNEALDNKTNFNNPKADEQKIEERLNSSAANLDKNNRQEAASDQKQAAAQMQQMAGKLQKAQEENEQQDIVINAGNLRQLIKRLVESSFKQEEIMLKVERIQPDDPSFVTWVQKQKDIQDNMKTVEDSLTALSERLPEIESTVINETALLNKNIEQAVKFLENRWTRDANKNQGLAMTSMNNLALMLSETLTKMQDAMKQIPKAGGGGGAGARQRKTILQLSELQERLNANMQAMRNKMRQAGQQQGGQAGKNGSQPGGPGLGGPMSEQFARMARQQAEIRHAIEQINEEENKDGRHQLGDLATLAKQMGRTEAELVNKNLTEATLARQLQISSRLLEAKNADQQRDQDSQREAKAPQKEIPPPGLIKALQIFEQEKSKQTEQLKTTPATLNGYYKSIVNKYFEQVNKQ
jgi:hypothetical protein